MEYAKDAISEKAGPERASTGLGEFGFVVYF